MTAQNLVINFASLYLVIALPFSLFKLQTWLAQRVVVSNSLAFVALVTAYSGFSNLPVLAGMLGVACAILGSLWNELPDCRSEFAKNRPESTTRVLFPSSVCLVVVSMSCCLIIGLHYATQRPSIPTIRFWIQGLCVCGALAVGVTCGESVVNRHFSLPGLAISFLAVSVKVCCGLVDAKLGLINDFYFLTASCFVAYLVRALAGHRELKLDVDLEVHTLFNWITFWFLVLFFFAISSVFLTQFR